MRSCVDLRADPFGIGVVNEIGQLPFVPPQDEDDREFQAFRRMDRQHFDLLLKDVERTALVTDQGRHVVRRQILLDSGALVVEAAQDSEVGNPELASAGQIQDVIADRGDLVVMSSRLKDKRLGTHAPRELRVYPVLGGHQLHIVPDKPSGRFGDLARVAEVALEAEAASLQSQACIPPRIPARVDALGDVADQEDCSSPAVMPAGSRQRSGPAPRRRLLGQRVVRAVPCPARQAP